MHRQATILVPPHLIELLAAGHEPAHVLELIDIHAAMERRRARGARWAPVPRGEAVVVTFPPLKR